MMMEEEFVDAKPTGSSHGPVVRVDSHGPPFLSETGVKADARNTNQEPNIKQNAENIENSNHTFTKTLASRFRQIKKS
jgi:hypothetical protein